MSDRELLPATNQQQDSQALADQRRRDDQDAFGAAPDPLSSPAPAVEPPRPQEEPAGPARRNWDRLTYGGIGGWFKRLFSSSKRAKHRAEIADRRAAWAKDQEGIREDPDYRPDMSLVKSNWAGKKMRQQRAQIDPDALRIAMRSPHEPRAAELIAKQGMLDRLDFFRTNVEEVDDSKIDPGPSRNRPAAGRSILKQSAPGNSQRNLTETDQERIKQFEDSHKDALGTEERAWKAIRSPDTFNDAWLRGQAEMTQADKTPENLAYINAFKRSQHLDGTNQRVAAKLSLADQGDLAFPEHVARQREGRQRALAFHQGYWKREQEVPKPTKKASHDRRVRFAEGSAGVEPLLNTPGDKPGGGEVVDRDAAGMPAKGRILPTGAYEYPAADPSLYGQYGSRIRREFNRELADFPDEFDKVKQLNPTFSAWGRMLQVIRNRPSQSARSRAKRMQQATAATAAEEARLNAEGVRFHMTRDEGIVEPAQQEGAESGDGSSQGELDSNQANVSEPDEDS